MTDKPLKYVVNTHHHGDHTGAISLSRSASRPSWRTRTCASKQQQEKLEPAKRGGLPELALGEEDPAMKAPLDVHLGNVEVHLVHFAAGHTDNDVLVGIPQRVVLHAGDIFFNGLTPCIDVDASGSIAGMLANVEWLLSWLPDGVRFIPGHGPVGGKKELAR